MQIVQSSCNHMTFVVRESWEKRNNPMIIEKTTSITVAAIQLWNSTHASQSLLKLSSTLKLFGCQYIYNIASQPLNWFPCISSRSINSDEVRIELTHLLTGKLRIFAQNDLENPSQDEIPIDVADKIARFYLQAQLENMSNNQDTFRSPADFCRALQNRMRADQRIAVRDVNNQPTTVYRPRDPTIPTYDLSTLDLSELQIPLVRTTLISLLGSITGLFLDILNVTFCLKSWKIVDTAKWTQSIGNYSVNGKNPLSFVESLSLEGVYKGVFCIFLSLRLIATCVGAWRVDPLAENKKKRILCQGIADSVDLIYQSTSLLDQLGLLTVPKVPLLCFSIFSKSVGIVSVLYMPKIQYCEVT